jgi:hypothetical protein
MPRPFRGLRCLRSCGVFDQVPWIMTPYLNIRPRILSHNIIFKREHFKFQFDFLTTFFFFRIAHPQSHNMPRAPVDNKGTELFYTDSGPVPGSTDYTTLVIYHGSAFTGREFGDFFHVTSHRLPFQTPSISSYRLRRKTTFDLSY